MTASDPAEFIAITTFMPIVSLRHIETACLSKTFNVCCVSGQIFFRDKRNLKEENSENKNILSSVLLR